LLTSATAFATGGCAGGANNPGKNGGIGGGAGGAGQYTEVKKAPAAVAGRLPIKLIQM